jgi:pimeloyl-ACP methyl ester carboxylesterase
MFLRAGLTVLALDSPGTGEATSVRGRGYEDDDILDGVFDLLKQEPMIDSAQVSVVGVSLGGNQAIRCAAYDRRILCAVAVTPPYDPARWLHRASPFLLAQLDSLVDDPELDPWEQADLFSLHDVALDVQCPVLIFGGARDLVVPPSESELLAARLGALGTLAWYPSGGHCLYAELPSWTSEAATWVTSVAAAKGIEMQASGVADPELIAAMAREQLEESTALGEDPYGEEDEGSARLIDPDDHDPDDLGASARLIERRTDDT